MSLEDSLAKVVLRHAELESRLTGETPGGEEYVSMAREFAELAPVVEAVQALADARQQIADLAAMIDSETDAEMRQLAREEHAAVGDRIAALEQSVRLALLPRDEADGRDVVLEVRAGAGGEEAMLFAGVLVDMYRRYAATRGWTLEILGKTTSGTGGIRECVALVRGRDVFSRLKFESGVHRVQRVPATESQGRIHTSTATVAILPEAAEVDVTIDVNDLRVDTFRASGAGGQHVNKTDSAVRITHLPTGIVVSQQSERSQHKNRARAMTVLRSRIYDLERRQRDAAEARARREQVGSGERSERIRTYNYPQGRISDHRINLTLFRLEDVISGQALDEVIEPLISSDRAARLAALR